MSIHDPCKTVYAHMAGFLRDIHADETVNPELKSRAQQLGAIIECAGYRIINMELQGRDRFIDQ